MSWLKYILISSISLTFSTNMHPMSADLEKMEAAANGLLFISESDYPLTLVTLEDNATLPDALIALTAQSKETPVETQTLDYFFRNVVRTDEEASQENKQLAQRFINLHTVLKEHLTDIIVYRIGAVQVDAFIIGKRSDGSYAGLRTKLIET